MITKHSDLSDRAEELADKQEALLFGEGRGGSRRSIVTKELQTMLELCYKNGVNPLPDLRKSYPAFAWRFVGKDELSEKLLIEIAEETAFVWFLPNSEFVSAKSNEKLANFANTAVVTHHDNARAVTRVQLLIELKGFAR